MNISIKFARLPHGMVYFYQHWIPASPRALVVFVHDLGDHIGRQHEFVERMAGRGYAAALYDQRGHGRSEGRRGHVENFSDWVNDLAGFVHFSQGAVGGDVPLFIVGAGLGAIIAFNFLLTHAAEVAGIVSMSAAVKPAPYISPWKASAAGRLMRLFPELSVERCLKFEDLTSDVDEIASLRGDSLFHRRVTFGALAEMERNAELVMAMAQRIYIPALMLAGSLDPVADPEGTRLFASRLATSDSSRRVYPGMMHDLLHEMDRFKVMDDIEAWIEQRSGAGRGQERQYSLHRMEAIWEDVSPPPS